MKAVQDVKRILAAGKVPYPPLLMMTSVSDYLKLDRAELMK